MVDHKKTRFLFHLKLTNQDSHVNAEKGWFSHGTGNLRLGRTKKTFLAVALICVIFISIFVLIPRENQNANANTNPTPTPNVNSSATPDPKTYPTLYPLNPGIIELNPVQTSKTPGIVESAQPINSSTWMAIARAAWTYYQIGVGVDRNTGLPWTGKASQYITDWDIGVYIQAVIDAAKLGLVDNSTFNSRIDKVMAWLETRELNSARYPYWFYQADTGEVWHQNSDKADFIVDTADTGRMFIALYNLKSYSPAFAQRVEALVYNHNNRSDYAALVPAMRAESLSATSIYSYYVVSGFACFWPSELAGAPAQILSNMFAPNTGTVTTKEGVTLPKVKITGDPLLSAFFELSNRDANLGKLVNLTYSAHEAYFNATLGKFRAFGEGPTFSTDWQWEWVALPDGRTWTALNDKGETTGISPMIYTKIAWSFLAIYNTNYTRSMAIYLEQEMPSPTPDGYVEGVDENGAVLNGWGSLTNGLILGAAAYYIQNVPY